MIIGGHGMVKQKKTTNEDAIVIQEDKIKSEKKHNGIISFWKFMFCILIVLHHSFVLAKEGETPLFFKGSIGVEFFFLVSGYLLAKKALQKNNNNNESLGKETIQYIWKKYKIFLPYTICAGIIAIALINIMNTKNSLYNTITSIYEIFLLRMAGFKGFVLNGSTWYISSMLMCMIILYPLIRKYKDKFLKLVAPVILIIGFGIFSKYYTHLRNPEKWLGLTYKGNIRAFLELLLGAELYLICEKLKKIDFTKFGKIFITLVEIGCFIIPFLLSHFVIKSAKLDYITLIIISLGVVLAFSEQTLEYKLFNNRVFYWLEKLSLPIYILHMPLRFYFENAAWTSSFSYYQIMALYVPLVLSSSIILMYIVEYFKEKHFYLNKFKNLIIENEVETNGK